MRKASAIFVIGLLFLSLISAFLHSTPALPGNSMWIEPSVLDLTSYPVGTKFNVTIWLNMTSPANSWQFYLVYNNVQLQALRCDYTGDRKSLWSGSSPTDSTLPDFYRHNATYGFVFHGEVLKSSVERTGAGSLSWVEFEIIQAPCTATEMRLDLIRAFSSEVYDKDINLIPLVFGKTTPSGLVAMFTYSPGQPDVNVSIDFDASSSYASGGRAIASYVWDFGDGVNATSVISSIKHAYTKAGIYTVTLVVTDDQGRNSTMSHKMVVDVFANLTVIVIGNGTTSPVAGVREYLVDTVVSVSAIPASGWEFHHWTLDHHPCGSANPFPVTMDTNHSLTAVFTLSTTIHPHSANSMWLEPDETNMTESPVGTKFYVTIWLNVTSPIDTWQFLLTYNSAYLNATGCDYTGDRKSLWSGTSRVSGGPPVFDSNNATHKFVYLGEGLLDAFLEQAGVGSLAWVEFETVSAFPKGKILTGELRLDVNGWWGRSFAYLWPLKAPNPTYVPLNYGKATYAITGVLPSAVLTINATSGGTTSPSPGRYTYTSIATVSVEAIPDAYYVFDHWSLDGWWMEANPINITIEANHTLIAVFVEKPLIGDITGDGKVDITDVAMVSAAFGSYLGHPKWKVNRDINGDGRIDIMDLALVCKNFGKARA